MATLLEDLPYLNPLSPAGWMVWLGLAGLLVVLLVGWRRYQPDWDSQSWGILAALVIAAPITALFLGIRITTGNALPLPGIPMEFAGSTMLIFSAIPWTLAGGLLGPVAAAGIGLFSGLLQGIWDTHSYFTMIELGLMAAFFGVASRQRYRTLFFRWLRVPLVKRLGSRQFPRINH